MVASLVVPGGFLFGSHHVDNSIAGVNYVRNAVFGMYTGGAFSLDACSVTSNALTDL